MKPSKVTADQVSMTLDDDVVSVLGFHVVGAKGYPLQYQALTIGDSNVRLVFFTPLLAPTRRGVGVVDIRTSVSVGAVMGALDSGTVA